MKDSLFSTKDIVKYLIVAGLVYTILKMIPSVQMNNKDLILVLAIITIGFVMIDCTMIKTKEEGAFQAELREAKLSNAGTDFMALFPTLKETIAPDPLVKTKI